MFYQVSVWPPTVCVFYVMSVCPIISDCGIAQQVPEDDKTFPIIIGGQIQDGIAWYIDFFHDVLEFDMMLKSNKPHVNKIKNIRRQ